MAFGKSPEQKQAEAQRAAAEAAANSPLGRAHAARARGDGFFQLTISVSELAGTASALGSSANRIKQGGRPDLLGQIEEAGWRLEHVGYVFIETGSTSTNRVIATGQGTVTKGVVQGIYLFRAA
jgi:hypothetical protein